MKLKVFLFSLLTLSIFIISCNKYEEGPMISLKSAEKRIAGDYTVDKYLINGVEINMTDQGIAEYRVVYNSDGTGKSYITVNDFPLETDFEWELDEKNENIRERSLGLNDEWSAWSDYKQILRLTNDEFWITDGDTEESTEFHFVEQ